MLKNYELLYIVHPDLEGSIEKVTEKVAGYITKAKGEIVSQDEWGKKKLAYPIAKNNFGIYVLVNFKMDSVKLRDIERELRISEEIIRSMIVIEPEKTEDEKPKEKEPKKEKAPASIIVKDEEIKTEQVEVKEEKVEKPKKTAKKTKETIEEAVQEELEEPAVYEAVEEEKRKEILDEKLDEILGNSKKKAK